MVATLTRSEDALTARVRVGRRYARQVAAQIASQFHPEKVVLFGSFAYGTPNRDSDIDLFVVARPGERPLVLSRRMQASITERRLPIDLIVLTPAQIARRLHGFDPFLNEILERGIVLYARPR